MPYDCNFKKSYLYEVPKEHLHLCFQKDENSNGNFFAAILLVVSCSLTTQELLDFIDFESSSISYLMSHFLVLSFSCKMEMIIPFPWGLL